MPTVPRQDTQVLGPDGKFTLPWYGFFRDGGAGSSSAADLTSILARLAALEAETGQTIGNVLGFQSVTAAGLLDGGNVSVALLNDETAPEGVHYYGTDLAGTKGWHSLFSGLAEGAGIALTEEPDGTVTVALDDLADAGTGTLLAFDRDSQGRVSGTRAVVDTDFPVDDTAWLVLSGTDTQAALDGADAALDDRVRGTVRLTVGTTAPGSPAINDLWVDTN